MTGSTSFDDAMALHQSGQIADAEEIYRRLLQEQPDHTGALHLLGVVRQQQGDYEAALELMGRAISINPNKAVYHNNYGAALQSLGRYAEAAGSFQRALAICPTYADALANLGMALASLGEDTAAAESYRAALTIQPGHADAMRQLASLLHNLGPGETANRIYEESLTVCSAAALAAPFRKLQTNTRKSDHRPQPAVPGGTSCDGACGSRYDGRNPFSGSMPVRGAGIPPADEGVAIPIAEAQASVATAEVFPLQAAGTDAPRVSVIMPVYNSAGTIERAIGSLLGQTFSDWEAVAVDDASRDGSWEILQAAAKRDSRIQVVRLAENSGPSAARNAGLRLARGEWIAYLDSDDEFYPDYLERLAAARDMGDVLMFGFDVRYEDGVVRNRAQEWDPRHVHRILFSFNPVVPLAAAHRRSLLAQAGGFNELVSQQEDWDLWKRFARRGAKFAFLPDKSGVYHVRRGSLSQNHRLAVRQRERVLANWKAERPIYSGGQAAFARGRKSVRKVAFVSPHCVLDFTNGAATATLDGLSLLARLGFECQAFCSTRIDAWEEVEVEKVLAQRNAPCEVREAAIGGYRGRMVFTTHGQIPVTLFCTTSSKGRWDDAEEAGAFLAGCELFLRRNRPDVLWTYGGDPVSVSLQGLARRLDIPVLFALHNFSYPDANPFRATDYVVTPTDFCRQWYWERLGLACLKLPLVVDPERVNCRKIPNLKSEIPNKSQIQKPENPKPGPHPNPLAEGEGKYVTFVNPEPRKGVHVFARVAEVLSRRRPDIPLLLVEGACKATSLPKLGIDPRYVENVRIMPNSPDARQFLSKTRLLLMPSLMENAALVAMEAMFNSIPVVASNRGGLPETIGDAAPTLEIPARYTPQTRAVPTAEEVAPWVETIIRLWDDPAEYARWSRTACEHAQRWHPDRLGPVYREFFSNITHQPGPPLVPREEAKD